MPILGSSNSAVNKDMMAKIWTNGGKIIVEKGEIANYDQFLLFPQCFQKQSVNDVFILTPYSIDTCLVFNWTCK